MTFTLPRIFYRYFLAEPSEDFYTEWDQCLSIMEELKNEPGSVLFKLTIFNYTADDAEYTERLTYVEKSLEAHFPDQCPTFSLINHMPELPHSVSVEAGYIQDNDSSIRFRKSNGYHYVVFERQDYKGLWASGLGSICNGNSSD